MMIRVFTNTEFIAPYRKSFYEKLCASEGFEWLVVRSLKRMNDGKPGVDGPLAINDAVVSQREVRLGPYRVRWQSGTVTHCARFAPDVIIVFGVPGIVSNWALMLWAKLRQVPLLMWVSGWEGQRAGSLALGVKQIFLRLFYSLPDKLLVYSSTGGRYLGSLGVGSSRIVIAYNGIEIDDLTIRENDIRANAGVLRARHAVEFKTVFLYVGAMVGDKRVDLLLRAFAQLDKKSVGPCALWLVGDGPDREAMARLAAHLGLVPPQVVFFGRVVEKVDDFFAAADFCVLPALGGLALNQAMFWGTPCIVSRADGTEDDLVLDGFTGKRFVPDSVESLRTALTDCANLPASIRTEWGRAARSLILTRSNVTEMVKTFLQAVRDASSTQTRR
ncbi:MAG: glycosyltransferase family 4 protein [Burkholderiales bacterium]|nr:glycosyltransferase family 4 protein [Burkholderiales bacterium]